MSTNRANRPWEVKNAQKFEDAEQVAPPYEDDPEVDQHGEINRLQRMLDRAKQTDHRWRPRGMEGVKFYHNRQWTEEDRNKVEGRGQSAVVINCLKPTANLAHAVLAQPVKPLARPVGDHDDDFSDSATASLMHITEVSQVNDLRQRALRWSLLYGVGYLMPGMYVRDDDPRREGVQVRMVDPREVRLDPECREFDLSDCRYFVWSRKVDVEQAMKDFPADKKKLDTAVGAEEDGLLDPDGKHAWGGPVNITPPHSAWDDVDWNQARKSGDYDPAARQVVLHELWERVNVKVWLLERKGQSPVEFDPKDSQQIKQLMDPTVVRYYQDYVKKVRCSIFAYQILLEQFDSPYSHDDLPLVAYFHDRDENGDPESFLEHLLDMQREVNHRRSKALWELSTLRLRVDPSVAAQTGLDMEDLSEYAARPDATFIGPPGSVEILSSGNLAAQQFELMQDAKAEIQKGAGMGPSQLGQPDPSSRSATAKQQNAQQSQLQMKSADFNLRQADLRLYRLIFSLIQQYHTEEWQVRFTDEIGQTKTYTLNQPVNDPQTGAPKVLNDLDQAQFVVTIDTMPWTPGRREYVYQALVDMAHNETDALLRQALHQAALTALEIPNKQKIMQLYQQAQKQQQAQSQDLNAKVQENFEFADAEQYALAQIRMLERLQLLNPQEAQMYRQQAMQRGGAGEAGKAAQAHAQLQGEVIKQQGAQQVQQLKLVGEQMKLQHAAQQHQAGMSAAHLDLVHAHAAAQQKQRHQEELHNLKV